MMKKYWFVLYPDTLIWVKEKKGLIYNVNVNVKIEFANEGKLAGITGRLLDSHNLYCVDLTEDLLKYENINTWVCQIVDSGCGNLVSDDGIAKRPLSLPPVLKVQDGGEHYKWEHKRHIDGNVIQNLHHLVFYMNGSESGNDLYSKQTLYPVKGEWMFDMEKSSWFALNSRYSSFLTEISFVGNPFKIPNLEDTINKLQSICAITIYVTIQDVIMELPRARELFAIANLNLLVADYTMLKQLSDIASWSKSISYTFIVTSEQEYEMALGYTEEQNLRSVNIVPVYTGTNFSFFEDYLFMDKEGLYDVALSKREIFIRQTLNIFNFGKLFVMPDGNVYSNLNDPPIGTINDSPHSIVYREITQGRSWLNIRDQQPCFDCLFQWLCPSPSNYEQVIGKPNLCHIKD